MKKFIFYTIKSVQDYCCTFSWRFNAGFSSFFWTSAFAKKLFFYATLLLLVFGQAPIYGQLVGGATVKAGFGIDGDAYANLLQFGNLAGPSNTDDWFNSTYPGNGRGVIKQTDPIPATPNEAFSFRQSITTLNSPYPYPLVPGVNDLGVVVDYLWLDAVYGRDNYVKGGSAEKSYFAGSGDKNSDNPSTWSIGTSGSVPQKDDLIDVYAHLRGEGPRIPFTPPGNTDPRPFTTLWAYAGASLVVTNGNKHVDFEFFRTALDEAADLSVPGATGPDGGRTAWTFNPDGSVAIPGTIIVSVDYTNGGTSPQVRIRVWMDETVFNNFNNLPISGRPFTVDPGTFESGTGSTVNGITYGYGVILPNVGTTAIWGRVNDNDSTLGPPWGTFEGSTPDAVTHYQALQFVEIGINLTAFGLDARGSQDPCSNILGSLLVKTRSSGGGPTDSTAFGSELKDFAGPFLFGNTGTPPVVTVTPKTTCSGLQVDLTEGASTTPSGGVIRYYTDDDYEVADEITNPTTYIPSETMTIYARSESVTNPGCYGTASLIVTVNNQPDAGTDGNTTVCDSSIASINLYSLITGEDAGGTWTRLTGTGGTFNAAAGTFVPTGATTSTFKYLLSATAPCVADESIATVNVNNQPDAGTDGNTTVCDSSIASIDLYSLITGEDAGGTWTRLTGTGGTFNAAAGTFVPTGATTSTFRYSLSATAPCVADESIATVNVNNQPDAGTDGNTTVCDSSIASIDLFSLITGEDAGGTWTRLTGTGGTFNAAAGTFVPTGATTSTFRYSLSATAPCVADESIATVNVNNQPDAGTDGNTTVCDSSIASINLYSLITGEDAGGTWTRLTGTGGTFNAAAGTFVPTGATTSTFRYSLSATAPCVADESIATVNVNNQPDAGTDGNTTVCDSSIASIDLFSLITGEDAGGTWTRLTGTGGTFNAAAGTFVPTGATTSTFRYSLSATAPCVGDESVATVNVNNQPDAGTDGNTTVCDISIASINLYSLITGEDAGGTWTRLTGTGGTFNAAAGTFVPTGATTSTFRYSLSATAPCVADESIATVNVNNQPDAGTDGNTTVCDSSIASIDLFSLITGEDAGGTWTRLTGTGGTFNAAAGTFVPTGATTSTFRYSLSATAPCVGDESIATVNVNNQPDAGTDGNTTVCDSSIASINLYSLITGEDAGGTWTRLTGTGGTFNAAAGTFVPTGATTSTFRYSLSATAPCVADESIATVNVNNQPDAGTDGNTTVCDSSIASIDLFSLITGEDAGGTWTRLTGTGGTFNAAAGTFVPTGATTSTFRYSLSATAPCVGDESIATVNVNNQPDAGTDGNTTVCDSSIASIDLFSLITGEDAGGTWTRLTGTGGTFNAAAGTFVPTGATTSTFRYSLSATAPCVADESIATVNVNNQPDAGTDGNTTVCDSSIASINLYSLITGEDAGGTWTRLTGTGGTFNAAAGTFVPTGATTSTFRYSLSATAPCVADESIATVNINPTPIALVLTGSTICASAPGTGTVSSTTSELGVSYQLRIGITPVQAPQAGTGGALSWINLNAGTNYNVVSTGVAPTNCPGSSNSVDVATEACEKALCTYTQGYYGNLGGMSCAPNDESGFDKYTTLELIERALASYGGTMTIGSLGNTVIITNTLSDREAIISVLPGGGSSYVLSGSYSISALPSSYLSKKGTINNTLLAQTIALGLNIGINGALSDFVLEGGILVTAAAEGGCGSDIPKERTCNYDINGNLTSVTNDYQYYSIDANVLAAIEGDKTVQGLFDLANKALGGGNTNGVSLTSIADVVDKINNAFDGCRIFIGYDVPKCPTTINTTAPIERTIETASFDAYPVPFKDELTIKYKFDYVSDVKIDVLNSQGVSVLSKMDNNSYMNKEVTLNLNSYVDRSEVYVVKVTTNRGSSVKKVISSK
ncbi:T9SS type A sorting domain-containing protein [Flavobacterium yafengii]|uniref:T9SS type A sorting domain-containing protein n=1 Tax=Flavobacterium yafengii TaxID=3041253 RepID=A0AAW6TI07_9FLAO|nr:T9SS type A sorting domain-containing protein [Flavobacterium yafengii]MDI5949256.1 T9SS type A sorting domain-containing protein [Flavobacterium yafengii]